MRTVIFFGLLAIAGALSTRPTEHIVTSFYTYVALVAMAMDIFDFFRDNIKKR